MGVLTPKLPDFDLEEWRQRPYAERLKMMCQSWAMDGFGAPAAIYVFYIAKIGVYIAGWIAFLVTTPGIGGVADIGQWWAQPIAFQKAVLWTLVFEVLGLGAASGPLTARYFPPFGGFLYFLRPGTTRLPPFPRRVPFTAGHRRTLIDVGLYALLLLAAFRALTAPEFTLDVLVPVVVVLPVLGLRDKTIFLASRYEHYYITLLVFLFPQDLLAGSKLVQLAIWWGAATSKLNRHFPSVIAVMVSNSPVLRSKRVRRAMYRDYPEDLRPSGTAAALAHGGTALEYVFPLVLVLSSGGWPTTLALIAMVAFHLYIMTSVPMGVPIEWNVFVIYAGLALFGVHAEVNAFALSSPVLAAILLTSLVIVPAVGNRRPDLVSFLPSMRYYAGNWGTSLWAFRKGTLRKLDEGVTKIAPTVPDQLRRFYDETTTQAILGKALAFRAMHLHGRALNELLPRAVDDLEQYDVFDGEVVAGVVLGWNFGDGHLHHEQLLAAVQAQCGFEPGELRCAFLESQPMGIAHLHWRICDAATGGLATGHVAVNELLRSQPWPDRGGEVAAEAPA